MTLKNRDINPLFNRIEKIIFGAMLAGSLATLGYAVFYALPKMAEGERQANAERVYLSEGRGYLEDISIPRDGIPDRRVDTTYLPASPGSFITYHKCTPKEIEYFKQVQKQRMEKK